MKADGSEAQACVPFSVIIVHQPLKSGVTNRVVDSFWGVGGGESMYVPSFLAIQCLQHCLLNYWGGGGGLEWGGCKAHKLYCTAI